MTVYFSRTCKDLFQQSRCPSQPTPHFPGTASPTLSAGHTGFPPAARALPPSQSTLTGDRKQLSSPGKASLTSRCSEDTCPFVTLLRTEVLPCLLTDKQVPRICTSLPSVLGSTCRPPTSVQRIQTQVFTLVQQTLYPPAILLVPHPLFSNLLDNKNVIFSSC